MKARGTIGRERRKRRILQRDGHRCVYCGATPLSDQLTVDHVEPRVKGGDHSDGNLVTCCIDCNRAKGGTPAWAFLAVRPELRVNFLLHAAGVWPRLRRAVEDAATS